MSVTTAARSVEGPIIFATGRGEKPVNETFEPGQVIRRRTGDTETHVVRVEDGRGQPLSIEANGFVLVDHPTAMRDFFDADELARVYYPEVEALVKRTTGARRVHIFDHTLRTGDDNERETKKIREPVLWAHNDYTEWSGPQRVKELLPDEAETLLQRRFAIVQVWRAIGQPIERNPLAMVDARTVQPDDLIRAERRYPNRVGETYQLRHNPGQRWIYFPKMRRDEAIVFTVYDSATDGRARFTPHSSFPDPTSRPDAPPRQSIEVRTIAFF
jgi:hypothetical protein